MKHGFKKIAALLPSQVQEELKRIHYHRQIKKGSFLTNEPEYKLLDNLLSPGDWVVDIGANIGHYTMRFSELVGEEGRVLAFEPVPDTFSLLAANVKQFSTCNVSLFNAAVSDSLKVVGMSMPKLASGLDNFFQAHISPEPNSLLSVLTIPLDSLSLPAKIKLVKIDAEGHEYYVIKGMRNLLKTSRPILIVEAGSPEVDAELQTLGYDGEQFPESPNIVFRPREI